MPVSWDDDVWAVPEALAVHDAYVPPNPPAGMASENETEEPDTLPETVPVPVTLAVVSVIVSVPENITPLCCVTCQVICPGPLESVAVPLHFPVRSNGGGPVVGWVGLEGGLPLPQPAAHASTGTTTKRRNERMSSRCPSAPLGLAMSPYQTPAR